MANEDTQPGTGTEQNTVGTARRQYMIALPGSAPGETQPMSLQTFAAGLGGAGVDMEIVRRIPRRREATTAFGIDASVEDEVAVVRMDAQQAGIVGAQLSARGGAIAEDRPLGYGEISPQAYRFGMPGGYYAAPSAPSKVKVRVESEDGKPIQNATVTITGDGLPESGRTNKQGEANVDLFLLPGSGPRMIHVSAPDGFWDRLVSTPHLDLNGSNRVVLKPVLPGMRQTGSPRLFGWGQRAMNLPALPDEIDGAGVRICIIDSGVDSKHPLLKHLAGGRDFTGRGETGWAEDHLGHGTHCAGVIGGRPTDDIPYRGFAPAAELHSGSIFMGGTESSLLEAIQYCIDAKMDVVNMSLGSGHESNPIVEEALSAARAAGIACIVATGNAGDGVRFPALSPQTFAVGALGLLSQLQRNPGTSDDGNFDPRTGQTPEGLFAARFSCFGPEVNCAGPGVGIISSVPADGFAPKSGTSMAAPHITGLAALLLAHHPEMGPLREIRDHHRVDALFGLLVRLCVPIALAPEKVGHGMPRLDDATIALMTSFTAARRAVETGDDANALNPFSPMSYAPMAAGQAAMGHPHWPMHQMPAPWPFPGPIAGLTPWPYPMPTVPSSVTGPYGMTPFGSAYR